MSRAAEPLPAPPAGIVAGDGSFTGLNAKDHPTLLQPGELSRSENTRLLDGTAMTRAGTRTPIFANSWKDADYQLLGSGVYSNPNGEELCLLCTTTTVVGVRSGNDGTNIDFDAAVGTLSATDIVEFSQQFDKILLHRNDSTKPVLVWDGAAGGTFVPVDPSGALGNGIDIIPNPPWSINFLDRAWFPVPGQPDAIAASDINDYTVYDSILHVFRVNAGTSDVIVGAYPFAQSALIVCKRRSIDLLANIPHDLGDNYLTSVSLGLSPASPPPPQMSVISTTIGMVARKSGKMVGEDFFFLSDAGDGGVYRIRPITNYTLGVDPVPVSNKITPLLKRINWQYAGGATAEVDGIYYCLAVPLDDATFNNAILIYNRTTEEWVGVDLWFGRAIPGRNGRSKPAVPNPVHLDNLLAFDYYGTRRLYAINHTSGWTHLLYEGLDDQLLPTNVIGTNGDEVATYPIVQVVETRAYTTLGQEGASRRAFKRLEATVATFDSEVTLTLLMEGSGDERPLTLQPLNLSRTSYNRYGNAPFQLDNSRGDFAAPGRGDYSILVGDGFIPGAAGTLVQLRQLQESTQRFSTLPIGRHQRLRLTNTGGRCALVMVTLESAGMNRDAPRRTQ